MDQGFFSKVKRILSKDVKEVFSSEALKSIGKIANTDVGDLVGDAKAAGILKEIEKNPDKKELFILLAEQYLSKGKQDKAVDIYLGLANKYLEKKNLPQAEYFINLGLKIFPDHGPLNMASADIDIRMERFSDAPEKYRRASNYYIKLKDKMTAIFLLRRIRDMQQATQKDLLNLAGIMLSENMVDDALEILNPLRETLKAEGEKSVKDREACLMMLHSLKKDDVGILGELVETRIETEQYERALILIKKLVSRDPKNINLLKRLAFVHKKMDDLDSYARILKNIANIYSEKGNLIYRNIYYHKILKYFPEDVEALSTLNLESQLRDNVERKIEDTDSKIKIINT